MTQQTKDPAQAQALFFNDNSINFFDRDRPEESGESEEGNADQEGKAQAQEGTGRKNEGTAGEGNGDSNAKIFNMTQYTQKGRQRRIGEISCPKCFKKKYVSIYHKDTDQEFYGCSFCRKLFFKDNNRNRTKEI